MFSFLWQEQLQTLWEKNFAFEFFIFFFKMLDRVIIEMGCEHTRVRRGTNEHFTFSRVVYAKYGLWNLIQPVFFSLECNTCLNEISVSSSRYSWLLKCTLNLCLIFYSSLMAAYIPTVRGRRTMGLCFCLKPAREQQVLVLKTTLSDVLPGCENLCTRSDLNPWPLWYRCSARPTELTSQLGHYHDYHYHNYHYGEMVYLDPT